MEHEKRKKFIEFIRGKDKQELVNELKRYVHQRFALVVQNKTSKKAHSGNDFRIIKKNIARIKTIISEINKNG